MKREYLLTSLLTMVLIGTLFLNSGCKKSEPPVVWDPNQPGSSAPFITTVSPPTTAIGGVTNVTLSGGNFSAIDTENMVYFGGAKSKVLSASVSQLVVLAPDTQATGLSLRLSVPGAFALAVYNTPYEIQRAQVSYGDFSAIDEVYSIAIDASENFYAQLKAPLATDTPKVYMVGPSGAKSLYGYLIPPFTKASEIKMGPGGYLYFQQTNNKPIYRIAPGGGTATLWVTLPGTSKTIDFDSSGNLYAGGATAGVFVVNPAGVTRSVGSYTNISIKSIRVFAGAVYILVDAPNKRVYKNSILNSNGDLGPNQVVFDWTNAGSAYASAQLFALTFAADGDMYIGTDAANPILIVHPDGTSEPLYPGVFPAQATQSLQFAWGTGTFLYVNRDYPGNNVPRGVSRISLGKNGAPYYGRNL